MSGLKVAEVGQEHGIAVPKLQYNCDDPKIPTNIQNGINDYLNERLRTGGFLEAVLSNDLKLAAQRADGVSIAVLGYIARWLLHNAPGNAWGSEEVIEKWLAGRQFVK